MASRSPGPSALADARPIGGGARAERVGKLLAGEILDTARLSYDFDVHHVALIAVGRGAEGAVEAHASAFPSCLIVQPEGNVLWAWFGSRDGFGPGELDRLGSTTCAADTRLAIGELGRGLAGWRLSHNQARAALSVAPPGTESVVRYADVALLASIVKDDLLAASLRTLYLEPLETERDGGEALRQTLRAYFAADRSITRAGKALGVTRQAVARRLRASEERLGRSLAACGFELEAALRLEALEATTRSGS